ncbi:nicotinate-nucleotide adenylyltransferase [bacterium]|nr:nicotinate-nucleotide adenylyltransferase [bacterium]
MSVCLYQGSFNPIHNAHLEVAEYVHKKFGFEKIVFIPAFKPPHKDLKNFDADNAIHRLNMVQIATDNIPYFDVSAIEYTRNRPSYTYDTIVQIKYIVKPKDKINFIIGTDAFIKIESWHRADELKELVKFILFVRENNFDETPFLKLKEKGYEYELMQMPFLDISATEVRERVRQNIDIYDIVPRRVADYIKQNNVYKI